MKTSLAGYQDVAQDPGIWLDIGSRFPAPSKQSGKSTPLTCQRTKLSAEHAKPGVHPPKMFATSAMLRELRSDQCANGSTAQAEYSELRVHRSNQTGMAFLAFEASALRRAQEPADVFRDAQVGSLQHICNSGDLAIASTIALRSSGFIGAPGCGSHFPDNGLEHLPVSTADMDFSLFTKVHVPSHMSPDTRQGQPVEGQKPSIPKLLRFRWPSSSSKSLQCPAPARSKIAATEAMTTRAMREVVTP